MFESLGHVQLRSAERVEIAVVAAPDLEWAPRVIDLLGHKSAQWKEQIREALTRDLGIHLHHYLLHRDNVPFSNVLIAEHAGVGLLGHVYTREDQRGKGAATILLERALHHFRNRGGEALYLGVDFDSRPYRMYTKVGFKSVEPQSGVMEWYRRSRAEFDARFFRTGPTQIQAVSWEHWPAAAPLLAGAWPGIVRCAPQGLVGRGLPEGTLLSLLFDNARRRAARQPPRGNALVQADTLAVVGLAAWAPDPLWPSTCLVDVYCHPAFWSRGGDLLASLQPPAGHRLLAYGESGCPVKLDILKTAGFKQTVTLPIRVAQDQARSAWSDVLVWEKA